MTRIARKYQRLFFRVGRGSGSSVTDVMLSAIGVGVVRTAASGRLKKGRRNLRDLTWLMLRRGLTRKRRMEEANAVRR
jgi:hypothetical protein